MQQLTLLWTSLNLRNRVIVVVATFAMFAAIISMSRIASNPTMALLYSGLENSAAGEVVQALQQRGIVFEVRGGSIFVDGQRRDELRLTLASEGLPENGAQGYELLDSISGFGTTSQMFNAAYWRAKEGELARTIAASPHIKSARVHISNSVSNPFQRNVSPKSSVSILSAGIPITASQANALRYLVASAVSGLSPDNVSVIDENGRLVGTPDDHGPEASAEVKARSLSKRVQRLLEAHVGPGNAFVEISIDTVTETESIRERTFDPDGRVVISTSTKEISTTSTDSRNTGVTVASNLPDGDGASDSGSSAQNSETNEQINYEVSETEREIIRTPGAIKRMTVAVLLNGRITLDTNGPEIFSPRTDEDLESLRELVASAVGFDQARGDIITIKSMALQSAEPAGTTAASSFMDRLPFDVMAAIRYLLLAGVILVLGLFVVRPTFANTLALATPDRALLPASVPANSPQRAESELPVLTGEIAEDNSNATDKTLVANLTPQTSFSRVPETGGGRLTNTDPVDRLRALIGERQEETVEILRGWLEDREENV